jgi:hypothetical protein
VQSVMRHLTFLGAKTGRITRPKPPKYTVVGVNHRGEPFTLNGRSKYDADDFAGEIIGKGGRASVIPELAR